MNSEPLAGGEDGCMPGLNSDGLSMLHQLDRPNAVHDPVEPNRVIKIQSTVTPFCDLSCNCLFCEELIMSEAKVI